MLQAEYRMKTIGWIIYVNVPKGFWAAGFVSLSIKVTAWLHPKCVSLGINSNLLYIFERWWSAFTYEIVG